MEGNKGKLIKYVARLKKMVGITGKKNRQKESTSSASPPHAVHCEELYLLPETPDTGTDHILRSHILAQTYFSQKPNIYL